MKYICLIMCLFIAVPAIGQGNGSEAPTDTLGTDPYISDTMVVTAPPVTVEEVIEAIAQRMERDNYLMRDYEYTTLVTQVLRDEPGAEGGDYKIEEYALRHHFSSELGGQVAKLWERSREYEGGEQVEDEVDEEVSAEFLPMQGDLIEAMPFSKNGGQRYHYNILDRKLVGNNLIYKISFQPKVKFEALPKGTIWVDYSNWVIRKFEAEMTDAVPFPMFLKSVPVYRMSQERFGEFWFPTEVFMRIQLRKIPLVPMPDNIEVRASLRDIVINGESLNPEDTAPGTGVSDLSPEELSGGFWLSEEANNDSLSTFWGQIGEQWEADLSPEAMPITLSMVKMDSLTAVGTTSLQDLREGSLWRVKPKFLKAPEYNRTQGLVVQTGLKLEKLGPIQPSLDLTAGYAFANKRSVFNGKLSWPILKSRWKLKDAPTDGREYLGAGYELLSLRLSGHKGSELFGGDGRRHTRSASAFFYGSDSNNYYENRGFEGNLKWRLSRELEFHAGGGYAEHRPWRQVTDWNVWGRPLHSAGNMAADYLNDNYFQVGGTWDWGPWQVDGDYIWHDYQDAPVVGGVATRQEINVGATLDLLDPMGNQWLLKGGGRRFDGNAPVQSQSWLGDYGTLRGYEAGELTGDATVHVALDARFGFDFFQAIRVPFLKDYGLQPIGFADWGKTWDVGDGRVGPVGSAPGARGWRMDVGFGFGKRFDVPGLGEFRNVRLYAAHPVGDGAEGNGWRVLLAFEK